MPNIHFYIPKGSRKSPLATSIETAGYRPCCRITKPYLTKVTRHRQLIVGCFRHVILQCDVFVECLESVEAQVSLARLVNVIVESGALYAPE